MDGHELMNSPRLFPPKFKLTPHHELEARARLYKTLFDQRAQAALPASRTDLNRPQIVRGGHDVLRENRDPLYVAMPFRRHVRRGARWRGEKRTQEGRIRDEHGFQNGQKCRAAVCGGGGVCEGIHSKADNKRRTGCGVLWIQLMASHLSKRGDRLLKLAGTVTHRPSTTQTAEWLTNHVSPNTV